MLENSSSTGPFCRYRILYSAFSPNEAFVASSSEQISLQFWDVSRGKKINSVLHDFPGNILCIDFSPDGRFIVCGGEDKYIIKMSFPDGEVLDSILTECQIVRCLRYSHDMSYLGVSGGSLARPQREEGRGVIQLISQEVNHFVKGHHGHMKSVSAFCIDEVGRQIFTGSYDGSIIVWDSTSLLYIMSINGHQGAIRCLALSGDCSMLASGGADCTLTIWRTQDGSEMHNWQFIDQ